MLKCLSPQRVCAPYHLLRDNSTLGNYDTYSYSQCFGTEPAGRQARQMFIAAFAGQYTPVQKRYNMPRERINKQFV